MRRFLLFAACLAAELCARRTLYEQDMRHKKDCYLSYLEAAQSAINSADSALRVWKERDKT